MNVEFPGGKVRPLVNYVSREIGEPGKGTGTMIPGAGEVLAQDTRSALQSLKSRSQ